MAGAVGRDAGGGREGEHVNEVRFVVRELSRPRAELPSFRFRPLPARGRNPGAWNVRRQREAWAQLERAGALQPRAEPLRAVAHKVDPIAFIDRAARQRSELLDWFGRRAVTLLIGGADYEELMNAPPGTRDAQFAFEILKRGGALGMRVHVIPWMSGMVVLPWDPNPENEGGQHGR